MMDETRVTSVAAQERSLSHYHHFLLGFLVPLVNARTTDPRLRNARKLLVPRCEPFEKLLDEVIAADIAQTDEIGPEVLNLRTHDYPTSYSRSVFLRTRNEVAQLKATQKEVSRLDEEWRPGEPRVLLIERGREPVHELAGGTSGAVRRSVPNQAAIFSALQHEYPGCLNVTLEGVTLARQFALFYLADVIVAQHGAALANLIWANPKATIIEIFPEHLPRPDPRVQNFFGNLAECLGIRYRRVSQSHAHAVVDVDELRWEVEEALSHRSSTAARHLRGLRFQARMFRWKAGGKVRLFIG